VSGDARQRRPARASGRRGGAGLIGRSLALVCVLLWTAPAVAQSVAHDGEADVTNVTGSGTTVTMAGKPTAGSNRIGIVGCVIGAVPGTVTATWDSVSMTAFGSATNPTDGRSVHLFRIDDPPTAASSVVVTIDNTTSLICSASSFSGAHDTQDAMAVGDSGTADPATVTCSATPDEFIVDALYFLGAATPPSPSTGTANTGSPTDQGSWFGGHSRQDGNNATSDAMTWTLTTPTQWTQVCNVIRAAAGSGGPTPGSLSSMGVGR
jgi:hypothetical protein